MTYLTLLNLFRSLRKRTNQFKDKLIRFLKLNVYVNFNILFYFWPSKNIWGSQNFFGGGPQKKNKNSFKLVNFRLLGKFNSLNKSLCFWRAQNKIKKKIEINLNI